MAGSAVPGNGKPVTRLGLSRYASPMVSFKPERLAPGEHGEAVIVMSLQKKAVFANTANLQVTYEEEQGPLFFGAFQVDPAKKAEVESFYKGQRVHDNFAIIRIPVQVRADVTMPKFRATFRVEANVSAGDTGHDHGRFALVTNGQLVIGKSIPRPNVRVPQGDEGQGQVDLVTKAYAGPTDVATSAVGTASGAAHPSEVNAASADTSGADAPVVDAEYSAAEESSLPFDEDEGIDWLLWGAPIGLVLVGLIALLARKR